LFLQLSLGGKKWLVLVDGGKKENRLDDCSTFERMEVSRDNAESLKFFKKFKNPLEFGSTTYY
jgi:hypothetical protein